MSVSRFIPLIGLLLINPASAEELEHRAPRLLVKIMRYCSETGCVQIVEVHARQRDPARTPRLEVEGLADPDLPLLRTNLPSPEVDLPGPAREGPVLVTTPGAATQPAPSPQSVASCGTAEETRALALLNAYRRAAGRSALRCDLLLLRVSRGHSQDMCDRGYFDHRSPEGSAPWDRLRSAGARFTSVGENIAQGYLSAEQVHQGWEASSGHRRNMLEPGYTHAAVGLVQCGGAPYWTQLFAR